MRGSGSLDVGLPTVIILQVVHALRLPPARVLPLVVEAAGSLAACCKASSPVWTTPRAGQRRQWGRLGLVGL